MWNETNAAALRRALNFLGLAGLREGAALLLVIDERFVGLYNSPGPPGGTCQRSRPSSHARAAS